MTAGSRPLEHRERTGAERTIWRAAGKPPFRATGAEELPDSAWHNARRKAGTGGSSRRDGKRNRKHTARKGKGEKVRQERTAAAATPRAGQAPLGARPKLRRDRLSVPARGQRIVGRID